MRGQAQDLPLQEFFGIALPKYLLKLHPTAPMKYIPCTYKDRT